ncbi:methyltransferase regulatory domain-containing protein [Endozoicomonas sp. SM1973]|uniref:Methyltransferase regulatory domain-containing protein n=1 Tax=Spartinivicinus marinus TaxID=2994442 RepID=A0A853I5K0_9GAMM|nr:methyltransferase regulatory domain-containing protein [Spartinivicinus marinus]MCX4029899.1 methyltransferase regulatory domain-containing protein [Spartinivicinus marinus]NYZ64857.1 methyltransferase regulatory domain-containing protein [Spartinivicinus marinus]
MSNLVEGDHASQTIAQAYNETLYRSDPFVKTHPEHLASLGVLFGFTPVNPLQCRVLEIGCAMGGNLIPMAMNYPDSEFIGIDISKNQIDIATNQAANLRLNNIKLLSLSIEQVDEHFGQFDFIICHGVFSWVPAQVQQKILEVCKKHLSEFGIAYISYNVHPGWHIKNIVKDLMRLRTQKSPLENKVKDAKAIVELYAKYAVDNASYPFKSILEQQLEHLNSVPDHYILHEHLADFNIPYYFYDFMTLAKQHQLTYLCDACFSDNFISNLPEEHQQKILDYSEDRVMVEQYYDFTVARTFRSSLLVHDQHLINPIVETQRIRLLSLVSDLKVKDKQFNLTDKSDVPFISSSKVSPELTASIPITKAALRSLEESWPCSLSFNELFQQSYQKLGLSIDKQQPDLLEKDIQQLCDDITTAFQAGSLRLFRVNPPLCINQISDKPLVSPLISQQLRDNQEVFTTQHHESLSLDDNLKQFIPYLNGTYTQHELANVVDKLLQEGKLDFSLTQQLQKTAKNNNEVANTILATLLNSLIQIGVMIN